MNYKQIKWLILIIPTLTIGMWEYVRHEFLLPYISMDLGNWLAPVLVLLVTLLFLTKLFSMIEQSQEELNRVKAVQAVLEEREKIARELHDGIAQSLFFLNTQVTRMERMEQANDLPLDKLKESVHHTNDYVRQAIANLRHAADVDSNPWLQGVESLIDELRRESDLHFEITWNLTDSILSSKEKVELLSIIREALLNIHKHADATSVCVHTSTTNTGWLCQITDNGKGFNLETTNRGNCYGLKMMQDRADKMSWKLYIDRFNEQTRVSITKGAT
ncbi:histidine kinase [Paenibacillus sp. UMB4589-SE434]|uniref:sensor histidine kinase n=1 Tax=Paenibacillus sp. UMB4589-SE434 TaxID=3046314 RepID=UPI00254BD310|nr:histidine kinase [Paenibacillus sp. UMB4589-SE434]MDK8180238.1 histidine kinase [Paenibacillus sp. UMB4589-SE434]